MNKIEQVARAIAPDMWSSFDSHCHIKGWNSDEIAISKANNSSIIKTLRQARAAIEAMRVPTEGMRKAVEKAEDDMGVCHGAYEHIDWDKAWPVAIDAALEWK